PFRQDLMHLVCRHPKAGFHDVVGFADELHIAVLNAVMDHLHVMARAIFADPIAARRAIVNLGSDALKNGLYVGPCRRRTAGHYRWTVARAFLTAGYTSADVKEPFRFHVLRPPIGVLEKGIAAIDDDVPWFEMWNELIDEFVDRLASFHHEHYPARPLELRHNVLDGMSTEYIGAFGFLVKKIVDLRDGTVVGNNPKPVVVHVEDEVLTHNGQAYHSDVSGRFHWSK